MMEFKNNKGIFQQIADNICERILSGDYSPGDKVPSVRQLAAQLGVNQNTIMRTFLELQHSNIVENRRGIGYFVTDNAPETIRDIRKEEFAKDILPAFIQQVRLLRITKTELEPLFNQLKENEDEN
jgi:DNA-binding transcriptional regulator YhcF (GntR family)